jgi:hypothetical protein
MNQIDHRFNVKETIENTSALLQISFVAEVKRTGRLLHKNEIEND